MKVKTKQGECELTAEMVCRGMVFAPKDTRDYSLGEGRVFVVGRRDEANGIWRDARDESLGTNVLGADRLLGCDPKFAFRADCERFGVYGDADAHGFARLKDGGAVDLRRCPHDEHEDLATGARWKADGESRPATKIGWFSAQMAEVSGTSVYRTPDGRTVEVTCVTDDEDHSMAWPDVRRVGSVVEFVRRGRPIAAAAWTHLQDAIPMTLSTASGFRFDGSGDLRSRLSGPLCGRCAKPVDSGPFGPMMLVLPDGEQKVSAPICQVCLAHVNKDIGAWRIRGGSIEETSPEDVARYGGFPEPTAEQWERLRAAFPAHFSAGRSVGDPHPISGSLADERRLHDCPRCASGPRRTYCSVACGDAEQAARRAADRRQREAPLVALVNACPKGLDPVGWRAGVLAYAEMFRSDADFHWFRKSDMPHVLAVIRDGEKSTGMNIRVFVDAYQRALAPRAKVAPERKGMTWKTRGPALPVDDGRDDD